MGGDEVLYRRRLAPFRNVFIQFEIPPLWPIPTNALEARHLSVSTSAHQEVLWTMLLSSRKGWSKLPFQLMCCPHSPYSKALQATKAFPVPSPKFPRSIYLAINNFSVPSALPKQASEGSPLMHSGIGSCCLGTLKRSCTLVLPATQAELQTLQ